MYEDKKYKKEKLELALKTIKDLDSGDVTLDDCVFNKELDSRDDNYVSYDDFEDMLHSAYETKLINQDGYEELKDILMDMIVDMMDDLKDFEDDDFESSKN